MSSYDYIKQFMQAFDQDTPEVPAWPSEEIFRLRVRIMMEEHWETMRACFSADAVEIIDGCCDCDYVNTGTAIAFGVHYPSAFSNVHSSNMSKLDPVTGKPNKDHGGKVIKPATYTPASLRQYLEEIADTQPPYNTKLIVQQELQKVFLDPKNLEMLTGVHLPGRWLGEPSKLG